MSDSDESGITHTEVSSPFEDLSDIRSPRADDHELLELPYMPEDPYLEAALQAPPSPDYVPGLEEPEHAPPSPDYVPGAEHVDADDRSAEDQTSDPEADPKEDDDEDPEEDPIDYPADGGDDEDDEMDIEEDEDADMDITMPDGSCVMRGSKGTSLQYLEIEGASPEARGSGQVLLLVTLLASALTWWIFHVMTVTHDVGISMTWDVVMYNQRFQELALLCVRMFPEESDKIERYVGGLPDMIHGNIVASKPKTMQEAIEMATEMNGQGGSVKLRKEQAENKRKFEMHFPNDRFNNNHKSRGKTPAGS
ncbi:hypothetical protein Tco_1122254 [Tanacetum coccineum]|uniref:Reverse transcriptase domain-containing protein n=1 Tax=Tanacetum coccineum TaxID=301880 RepID=A0ABQ5J090_9ASTR